MVFKLLSNYSWIFTTKGHLKTLWSKYVLYVKIHIINKFTEVFNKLLKIMIDNKYENICLFNKSVKKVGKWMH